MKNRKGPVFALALALLMLSSCKGETKAQTTAEFSVLTTTAAETQAPLSLGPLKTTTTKTQPIPELSETEQTSEAPETVQPDEEGQDAPASENEGLSEAQTSEQSETSVTSETYEATEEELLVALAPEKKIKQGLWLERNTGGTGSDLYYFFGEDGNGQTIAQENGAATAFSYEVNGEDAVIDIGLTGTAKNVRVGYESEEAVTLDFGGGDVRALQFLSEDTPASLSFYTSYELRKLALAYYSGKTGYCPAYADSMNDPEGLVTVRLYDMADDHGSTSEWYYIDRFTAQGTDALGTKVDLSSADTDAIYGAESSGAQSDELKSLLKSERRRITGEGALLGAAYLGIPEITGLEYVLSELGYSAVLGRDMVRTRGGSAYLLLIPADKNASFVIRDSVNGNSLYFHSKGEPVILICDTYELLPDSVVNITDSEGNTIEWKPSLSAENGTLLTGRGVADLTDYKKLSEIYGYSYETAAEETSAEEEPLPEETYETEESTQAQADE